MPREQSIPRIDQYVDPESFSTIHNLGEYVGKEVVILDCEFRQSRFGDREYCFLSLSVDGEVVQATTGVQAIVRLMHALEGKLPVRARVVKDGRFYRLQ
jgi:hypothetical protein